jgi:single-stranded-DNA-specific exonuclease
MGDEGQHCRFTLSSGGARARGVAFRTAAGSLTGCGDDPLDVALRLELNRWNGAVEPRVVLRALCRVDAGEAEQVGSEGDFWADLEAALDVEPDVWSAIESGTASRELRDHRGQGFAGVAGDLISTGEPVLVVCADVARRREALERVLGEHVAPLVSWSALAAEPSLAAPFSHVVALDPPPAAAGEALLPALPGDGFAHLAWGEPEVAFALALAQAELDLRPPLTALYRALRDADGASGEELRTLLVGDGRFPRSVALCGRLLRVFLELGLVTYSERQCALVAGVRADLEAAVAYQRCQQQLGAVRAYLGAAMPRARAAA